MISIKKYKNLFIQNNTIATIIDLIQEQELKQNARDKQTTGEVTNKAESTVV